MSGATLLRRARGAIPARRNVPRLVSPGPASTGIAVAVAFAVAGCGAAQPRNQAPAPSAVHAAFVGSPAALTALHAEGSQLLGGGRRAFKARLSALRGHPVVVNAWASWCPSCRDEFPLFQTAAVRLGRHVAFLGVDTLDQAGDARAFLRRYPVAYPSYEDGSGAIARSMVPIQGVPMTIFFDAHGRMTYFHQGPYRTEQQLVADVARYAEHR